MDSLIPVFVVGIIALAIYRLFELFVRRNERMAIIEKLQSNVDPSAFANKLSLPFLGQPQGKVSLSQPLRVSLLMIGVGVGLLVGFVMELCLTNTMQPAFSSYEWRVQDNISSSVAIIYLASVCLFGGLGLLGAYLIEQKKEKKKRD